MGWTIETEVIGRTLLGIPATELKGALSVIWVVSGFIGAAVLVVPFVFSAVTICNVAGLLSLPGEKSEICPLCGMTTAFIAISQGKFKEAFLTNSFSPMIYGVFLINAILSTVYLTQYVRSVHKGADVSRQLQLNPERGTSKCKYSV